MENSQREQVQPLAAAYEERTKQLHEARGALAEAVSTLRLELEQRREEAIALTRENGELRKLAVDHHRLAVDHHKLHEHAQALSKEVERLEAELISAQHLIEVLRNMKVVRWTVRPRRLLYRMRERHR